MAEQEEPTEARQKQAAEALPEQPVKVLPERPAEVSGKKPGGISAERSTGKMAGQPAKVSGKKPVAVQAMKREKGNVTPAKKSSPGPTTVAVTSGNQTQGPGENTSKGVRRWKRWLPTIVNALILAANVVLVYPTWRAAKAEETQARVAERELAAAQQESIELADWRQNVNRQLENLRDAIGLPPRPTPPPPSPSSADLVVVPESFNCAVNEQAGARRLLKADICYELRFAVLNKGAVNRRVKAQATFSREGRFWTCSSEERTVAYDREEHLSIPLISCFNENEERRVGNIDFSLHIEGPVE